MSWFSPRPPAQPSPLDPKSLDALLAKSIKAQERAAAAAAAAADEVVLAADESCEHVEAVVGAFKERTAERLRSRKQTLEQLLARDL